MIDQNKGLVYLLHGDDKPKIIKFIQTKKEEIGDSSIINLNLSEFDGRSSTLDVLRNAALSVPFIANRRLIIVYESLSILPKNPADRPEFCQFLESIPQTTCLMFVIDDIYKRDEWGVLNDKHWLVLWARTQGPRVSIHNFAYPKGKDLLKRILEDYPQEISRDAALRITELVGDDPQLVIMELEKLFAYVNYARPIQVQDIESLTVTIRQENVFDFVDALCERNERKALQHLRCLLEDQDSREVFAMVIRQFRLLIQSKEIIEQFGGREALKIILKSVSGVTLPFIAQKLTNQARSFHMDELESIYHYLAKMDEEIKLSKTEIDTVLYLLTADLAHGTKLSHLTSIQF